MYVGEKTSEIKALINQNIKLLKKRTKINRFEFGNQYFSTK